MDNPRKTNLPSQIGELEWRGRVVGVLILIVSSDYLSFPLVWASRTIVKYLKVFLKIFFRDN